jgi:hypothetical protein
MVIRQCKYCNPLWTECLNSDIQELHEYQHSEEPPLTLNDSTHKDHDVCQCKVKYM